MSPFVYWLATTTTRYILLPVYARVRVTGLENVPMSGPLIIVSNHLNDADPGIICTRIRRRIVFMAKIELFKVPLLGQFMRAFGAFPVRRNEADLSALRRSKETLDQGLALCIFPEGTREGPPEQLLEAWPGAAIVAFRNHAPILPIAITGSGRMSLPLLFLRVWKRYEVTLTVGKPFYLDKPDRLNAATTAAGTRTIMEKIAALLPEAKRGYYGTRDSIPGPTNAGERSGN
jgi:1-acyl-sn-glycerol-3-phosphate acyltransferase